MRITTSYSRYLIFGKESFSTSSDLQDTIRFHPRHHFAHNVTAVGEKKTIVTPREFRHEFKSKSRIVRIILARLNVSFEQMYIIWVMLPIWIIHDPNMTRYFKEISNPLNIALSLAKSLLGTGWKLWNETIPSPLHPSRADYLSRLTLIIHICNLL